jgi:LysR family transcriptional regulator, cyn operon transcriptional activator
MDLRQLEMFKMVAETSSFTRAGEKLHVSHSAISRQVKLLEDELRVELFVRANNRVFLTEPGKVLLSHAIAIFDQVVSATRSVSQMSTRITHHVTLGTGSTMLDFFLPPVFEEFKRRYPSSAVHIKTGQWPVMIQDVRTGMVDLVIGSLPPFIGRELLVQPLYREELVVVVGKHHPLAKEKVIQPQELNDLPLIAFPSYSTTGQILENLFHQLKISLNVQIELENDEAVVDSVSRGLGVAFLPKKRAIQHKLHFGRLANTPIFRTVGLVSLHLRHPSTPVADLSTLCLEHARSTFTSD